MQQHPHHPSNLKIFLTGLMLICTILAMVSMYTHGCSVEPKTKTKVVSAPPPPTGDGGSGAGSGSDDLPPAAACNEATRGVTKDVACQAGQVGKVVAICTDEGWAIQTNSCAADPGTGSTGSASGSGSGPVVTTVDCTGKTTFRAVQPLISLNCAGCHPGFDGIDKAKAGKSTEGGDLFAEMLERIQKPLTDAEHMPAQRPSLAPKDIAVFKAWDADGRIDDKDCAAPTGGTGGTPAPTFTTFQTFETEMFSDVAKQNVVDQPNIRFLVAMDEVNLADAAGLAIAKAAAAKAINSVSTDRDITVPAVVAPGVWRIDISDYGISPAQWTTIENASLLQLESFTQQGLALKNITKSRLPWMDVADFNDTVLRNATIYYNLTRAPDTLQQLLKDKGVDFAGDLANGKALLIGFNGSSLSPAANRLMARHDSSDGFFWSTFDTGPIVNDKQNLFANPLLAEAGGVHNLQFAAGEQLYSLPNGLIGSFLATAAGARLNEADANVVHDFTSNPVSPIIKNSISCFRCHAGGILRAVDKVRDAVPSQQLGAKDTQLALALFKPQAVDDRVLGEDNALFGDALKKLGLDPQAPDPISQHSDKFLGDLSLAQVAAKFVLRPEELTSCLALSPVGSQQLNQLTRAGTASHDQIVQASKQLQEDCLIFRDPLNQDGQ